MLSAEAVSVATTAPQALAPGPEWLIVGKIQCGSQDATYRGPDGQCGLGGLAQVAQGYLPTHVQPDPGEEQGHQRVV